ncbi:MAG: multiple sugar transport system substrate-binding protein [Cellvibrionaceae bacterium]|jgi:multiple sugar transport system substrate-binding protein
MILPRLIRQMRAKNHVNSRVQLTLLRMILVAFPIFFSACAVLPSPPRLTTTRTISSEQSADTPFYAAPTPTGEPLPLLAQEESNTENLPNPILTIWVNETSEAHRKMLEEMTQVLDADYGLHLEFVLIDGDRLPDIIEDAAEVNRLPDVIIHPIEYSAGWAARGILDAGLSESIIETLGRETFEPDSLQIVLVNGQNAAIPINGHKQILIYRQDWFDTLRLSDPIDYSSIFEGAKAIYRSETLSAQTGISSTLLSGLVVPTESDLISTHQVFEHFANANGCRLIDDKGEVVILSPECVDTFEFYRELINGYSPNDIQTDTSAINAYLSGRTGIIFGSPDMLVEVAGLSSEHTPVCPECLIDNQFLTVNSSIQTQFSGRASSRKPIGFGQMTLMGFTPNAQPELAEQFASYWFNDGYALWLGVEPARRVPMRLGDAEDPEKFLNLWYQLPISADGQTLVTVFGEDVAANLTRGIASTPRWGIDSGQGDIIATIYKQNMIAIVLQEMLSGYFTSNQALVAAWERAIELIPEYQFETEIPEFIFPNDDANDS